LDVRVPSAETKPSLPRLMATAEKSLAKPHEWIVEF
jgi:hypothetical protein